MGDEEPRDKRDSRDEKKEYSTVEMSGAEQPYKPLLTEGAVLKLGCSCCMLLYCCNLWMALSRHGAGMACKLLIE